MSTIQQDLAQIRQAVYGREVREAIADGIEHCYSDVSTAKTIADTAAENANTKAGLANTAATTANTAATNANNAATAAMSAADDIFGTIDSTSNPKNSTGNPIELFDAVAAPLDILKVTMEPQQDLHGYDKPWPAGTGKNLFPATLTAAKAIPSVATWSGNVCTIHGVSVECITDNNDYIIACKVTGTADDTSAVELFSGTIANTSGLIVSGCPSGGGADSYAIQVNGGSMLDGGSGVSVASGTSITSVRIRFANGYAFPTGGIMIYPMVRLASETDATYKPYANICPITGYSAVNVERLGKNLAYRPSDSIANIYNGGHLIPCSVGDTFYVYAEFSSTATTTMWAGIWNSPTQVSKTTGILANLGSIGSGVFGSKFVATHDGYFGLAYNAGIATYTITKVMISKEPISNINDYIPPEKQTLSVTFSTISGAPSTVYGGTLTVNRDGTGTLVVDRLITSVSSIPWAYASDTNWFYWSGNSISTADKPITPQNNEIARGLISSFVEATTRNNLPLMATGLCINNGNTVALKTGDSVVSDMTAKYGSEKIGWELATPQSYSLTAVQLQTLLAYNCITCDSGDMDIVYRTDKYAQLDKFLAAIPTGTASGSVATFTDGADGLPMKQLQVAIEPKQDLHGYDKPWAGGGGKNILYNLNAGNTTTSNGITFVNDEFGVVTAKAGTADGNAYSYLTASAAPLVLEPGTYTRLCRYETNGTTGVAKLQCRIGSNAGSDLFGTASSAQTVTITETTNLVVRIGVSDGTTFANDVKYYPMIVKGTYTTETFPAWEPYSNICPISGWDEVNVTRVGKNLLDATKVTNNYAINASGSIVSLSGAGYSDLIKVKNGSTYVLSAVSSTNSWVRRIHAYDSNGEWLYEIANVSNTTSGGYSVNCTIPNGVQFVRISYWKAGDTDIQFEFGSTKTTYEPYTPATLSVNVKSITGDTVYGGTLTINADGSGTVVVDRAVVTFDGTENGWVWTGTSGLAQASIAILPTAKYDSTEITYKCNSLTPCVNNKRYANKYNYSSLVSSGASAAFSAPGCDDLATFKTFVGNNGIQFCYELATSITYTLTATQLQTLLGVNHISADCGNVYATYYSDLPTTLGGFALSSSLAQEFSTSLSAGEYAVQDGQFGVVVQSGGSKALQPKKIADEMITDKKMLISYQLVKAGEIKTKYIAPQRYTTGQYVSAGQFLLKATTTINSGDFLVPGTNCVIVELGNVLNNNPGPFHIEKSYGGYDIGVSNNMLSFSNAGTYFLVDNNGQVIDSYKPTSMLFTLSFPQTTTSGADVRRVDSLIWDTSKTGNSKLYFEDADYQMNPSKHVVGWIDLQNYKAQWYFNTRD